MKYPSLQELKEQLGNDYTIQTIDMEQCLYRDFGNGFNVEISGFGRENRRSTGSIYLWFGDKQPCVIARTVSGVPRNASAIRDNVNELYAFSEDLIAKGHNSLEEIFKLKHD